MEVIFILLPISLVLILLALRVLSWAIEDGQFEDLDREAARILFDEPGHGDGPAQGPEDRS